MFQHYLKAYAADLLYVGNGKHGVELYLRKLSSSMWLPGQHAQLFTTYLMSMKTWANTMKGGQSTGRVLYS